MPDTALVIMARTPESRKVKTRLAASIGAAGATQLYSAFLSDLAQRFSGWDYALHWAYTSAGADFDEQLSHLTALDASLWSSFPQCGEDFADRLYRVFRTTRMQGFRHTIVIASDSPQISRETITHARRALDDVDLVLGPAEDGGYYLIAMREPHDVFHGIPMSTERVLRMTIDRARSLNLSIHLLETLFDVDELADLRRLTQLLQEQPDLAPATAAQLTQLLKEFV